MPQPLNTRESNLFRQVIRNYEDKQYKRGVKAADQILRRNPKHGDTMAMKALIMNAQGRTDEAFVLGKEALTQDVKSHICWHVYGLLYRTNKNFEEAIKAYKFALRLEPESHQIQRDLAVLQIQMRDYQGYVQSRTAMLQARPQLRQNWTGLAVAQHLAGDLTAAEGILSTYEGTLRNSPPKTDFEHAEAVLYKNMIIAEMGDTEKALDHLESSAKRGLDRLAVMECRASYLTQLGRKEEAAKAWRALLERNAEHADYYASLVEVLDIADNPVAKKALFDEYSEKFSRCDAARRIPLDFLTGDEFKSAARSYLTLMLNKGVPSTFANLKHLYADPFKKETLPALAHEYLQSVRSAGETNGDSSKGEAAALYFLAQHYDYRLSRDLAKAKEYCEEAIALGPANVDFHMTRARIWKHHGNTQQAAKTMDHARSLDTRDRYINSKAAKYQLRNNENERALETIGLFTRGESPAGPLADLLDMQCVWFLTEDGEAYVRRGNIGLALKRFHAVWNIFEIWQEDQFDFHSFSLRKGVMRTYVEMVRWEDRLREHPFYTRAALDAARVYLQMHDEPSRSLANGANGELHGDDAAEKRKAAKKAKKEAQKAEREAADKAAKQDPNKGGAGAAGAQKGGKQTDADASKKKDDDPLGLKLAETKDPLGEAMKYVGPMLQFSPKNIDAQVVGFEIFMRRKKYVLALRCFNAARALDPEHPLVHQQGIELRHTLNSALASLDPKVQEVFESDFVAVAPSADLKAANAEFRARHQGSVAHTLAAIHVDRLLGANKSQYEKEVLAILETDDLSLEDAVAALDTLKAWGSIAAKTFRSLASEKWPEATVLA